MIYTFSLLRVSNMIKKCGRGDLERILAIDSIALTVAIACITIANISPMWVALLVALAGCLLISYVLVCILKTLEREKTIVSKGKTIVIRECDIFSQSGIIVIPFNRYFDTTVNNRIIADSSLNGQFISKHYSNSVSVLDKEIDRQLSGVPSEKMTRTEGKNIMYSPGTIVSVGVKEQTYVLLALTEFDSNNNAGCHLSDYAKAILDLMNYLNINSQGRDVSIPLIGGGLSRMNMAPEDLLELLVALIKADKHGSPNNITICLTDKTLDKIDLSKIN